MTSLLPADSPSIVLLLAIKVAVSWRELKSGR